MIKKQTRTIIICSIIFVVLLIAYLVAIRPLLKEAIKEEEPPELLAGEVLGTNNRILMFKHVQKADILSIKVHNEYGEYEFYRGFEGDNDNFYIKNMEGAPYSLEMLSSLVVSSGYTLSIRRLEDKSDDLSVYGLADSDSPAWYVLTQMDGTEHKVYIGDPILTGGGYYCMYDGRDAVYVLDTSIGTTLLADVKSLITPSLGYQISTQDMMNIDDFQIIKNGEMFIWVDTLTAEESGKDDGTITYDVKSPSGIKLNTSTYSSILEVFTNFAGTETVACGNEVNDLDSDMLKEKYGIDLDNPYYLIHYAVKKNADKQDVTIDTFITFSKPDENGDMYAYSTVFNLVAKINIASAAFINWDILKFVESGVFAENINDVSKIMINGSIANGLEKLDVDAYFTLDGEKETIIIKQNGEAKAYDADAVKNFRQLYKTILGVKIGGYADVKDTDGDPLATMVIELDNGEKLEYKFYAYSTRRCYYTINGEGEFHVLRDSVEKLLRDTDRMVNGLPINSDDVN